MTQRLVVVLKTFRQFHVHDYYHSGLVTLTLPCKHRQLFQPVGEQCGGDGHADEDGDEVGEERKRLVMTMMKI